MTNLVFKTCTVQNWDEVIEINQAFLSSSSRFAFRGQKCAKWELKTSIERVAERFSIDFYKLPKIEKGLIRKFQREAYLYLKNPPDDNDGMQWRALMQHHGAPTRLLDWTYSFLIAVYFAIENADPGTQCAVWAIDYDWLREYGLSKLPNEKMDKIKNDYDLKERETVEILFDSSSPISSIYRLNPNRLNQRLILQQGLFLAPGDISRPFMYNLQQLSEDNDLNNYVQKIIFHTDVSFLKDAILHLHRMNINRATLFPGLDGFSASLHNLSVVPEAVVSDGIKKCDGNSS